MRGPPYRRLSRSPVTQMAPKSQTPASVMAPVRVVPVMDAAPVAMSLTRGRIAPLLKEKAGRGANKKVVLFLWYNMVFSANSVMYGS